MANLGQVVQDISSGGMSLTWIIIWSLVAAIAILFLAFAVWFAFFKVKWNLRVEFKLPRSDGKLTLAEWGKGFYDPKKGAVMVKRAGKGSPKVPIKIFDPKKYLQGSDIITVIQVGPEDYRPVLNSSYSEVEYEVIDEDRPMKDLEGKPLLHSVTNEPLYHTKIVKDTIMNIQTETGKNKAWKAAFQEAAENAYTMKSIFKQYQTPIAIGIVVICCFIGFAVLWTKLSSIC